MHVSSLLQICKKAAFSGWRKCRYDGESANNRQTGGQKLLPTCLCVELRCFISSGRRLLASFAPRSTLRGTASEVVIGYVLGLDAEVVEHIDYGAAHGAGTAHVVLDVLGGGVVLEVGVVHDLVDEAGGIGHAGGIGSGVGPVEGEVEVEVGEVLLQLVEVVEVEHLVEGAGAVEVVHGAVGAMQRAGEVHDLCTERCHTGAAAHPYHLVTLGVVAPGAVLGSAYAELAVRAAHDDLVAGLQREDVTGGNTRIDVLETAAVGRERRRGDSYSQHEDVALGGVVGHGVGADGGLGVDADEVEHLELLPCGQVLVADEAAVEVAVLDAEGGNLDLCVAAGHEVHVFSGGQLHLELLDEGGHVAVRYHGALVFLDAEDAFGKLQRQVFLHLHLAAEAPAFLYLFAAEVGRLGGEYAAAALDDAAFALSAGAFAAAGRGKVDALFAEGADERAARRYGHFFVVVDGDLHVALRYELGAQNKQQRHQ